MENNENDNVENTVNEVDQTNPIKEEAKLENNEGPMSGKKKSKKGLIIAIIIVAVILVVLIVVAVYLFIVDKFKQVVNDDVLTNVTSMLQEGQNYMSDTQTALNYIQSDVFGTLTNAVDNANNNTSTVEPSNNVKTSTLQTPLQVGEWGTASKYNTETKGDQNVNVRVSRIIRGDEAKKMAQDYMNSDYSIYKYEEPEGNQEWVVIEYDVDFGDTYVPGELGASPTVDGDVTGPDGGSIKYNGISYINSVIEIGSRDYIKTKTGSGKLLTQIPIGCTDYIIDFGTYNGTHAYFKGQ